MVQLTYSNATLLNLDSLYELEKNSYQADEAASKEQLRARIEYAQGINEPQLLFLIAHCSQKGEIVGFLCSTISNSPLVTEKSMSVNEPYGRTVCLHSVCVSHKYRRQGMATKILQYWINLHQQRKLYERIALLSRPSLLPLYTSVGFIELGVSSVVHGPEKWYDCVLDISTS